MDINQNKINQIPLIETFRSSEALAFIQEALDVGLDQFIKDPLVKEIPIVKWIFTLKEVAMSVRDFFLIKKIFRFINELDKITGDEKSAFIKRIEKKIGEKDHGEYILIVLDRYDHVDKATFLSKIFCAYVMEEITADEFFRISTSIDQAYIEDLRNLLNYYTSDNNDRRFKYNKTQRNLFSANLSDFYVLSQEEQKSGGLEHPQVYGFNTLAKKFAKIILREKFIHL